MKLSTEPSGSATPPRHPVLKGLLWISLSGTPAVGAWGNETGEVRSRCFGTAGSELTLIASAECLRGLKKPEGRDAFSGAISSAVESANNAAQQKPGNAARALVDLGDKAYWQNPPTWGAGSKAITEPYFGSKP